MFSSFFKNKQWAVWAYAGAFIIILSLVAQVWITTLLNAWYKDFYDVLQNAPKYKISDFYNLSYYFMQVAMPYVILATLTNYFARIYAFKWRQAITFHYVPMWQNVSEEIEGASQRIQEDTARFAKILEALGMRVLRAFMTLIAFVPILWGLSSTLDKETFPILSSIDGALVYVALLFSLGGLVVSWFVGIKLPHLEYNIQREEAAFRKELVYGEDNKQDHAQTDTLVGLFTGVRVQSFKLYLHYGYFDIWAISYSQATVLIPFLFTVPALFKGAIALGLVMQVSNAFGRVHDSFDILIDNWTTITELRSVRLRLVEFEKNLKKYSA